LGIAGMSCKNCTHSINNAVGGLNGVKRVSVDPEAKKVSVEFDDERVSIETIKDVIEDQGYQVR
jgi:copper chaperone